MNDIYERAIKLWGDTAQLRMLQEESTELSLAAAKMCRHFRAKDAHLRYLNLAEEIADVEIMIEQMHLIFPKIQQSVTYYKLKKLDRLNELVTAGEKKVKS